MTTRRTLAGLALATLSTLSAASADVVVDPPHVPVAAIGATYSAVFEPDIWLTFGSLAGGVRVWQELWVQGSVGHGDASDTYSAYGSTTVDGYAGALYLWSRPYLSGGVALDLGASRRRLVYFDEGVGDERRTRVFVDAQLVGRIDLIDRQISLELTAARRYYFDFYEGHSAKVFTLGLIVTP